MPKKEIKFGQIFVPKISGTLFVQTRVITDVGTHGVSFSSEKVEGSPRIPIIPPVAVGSTKITDVQKWSNRTMNADQIIEAMKRGYIRKDMQFPDTLAKSIKNSSTRKSRIIKW